MQLISIRAHKIFIIQLPIAVCALKRIVWLQVENLFRQHRRRLTLYKSDGSELTEGESLLQLSKTSLHACVLGEKPSGDLQASPGPCCMFVNVHATNKDQKGTLLLENPRGSGVSSSDDLFKQVHFFVQCPHSYDFDRLCLAFITRFV